MAVGPTLFLIVLLLIAIAAVAAFAWGAIPDLISLVPILAVVGVVLVGAFFLLAVSTRIENSTELSAARTSWHDLRESKRKHRRQQTAQRRADEVLRNTRSERWEEADNLNEQFVADVYPGADEAARCLARQLAAHLQRDGQGAGVRIALDFDSFNGLSENLDVAERIRLAFINELKERNREWQLNGSIEMADGGSGNVFIKESASDGNRQSESGVVPLLVTVELDDATKYQFQSRYVKGGAWGHISTGRPQLFEYGRDGDGTDSCAARADAQMLPHIWRALREVNLNLDYLKENKAAYVRSVTESLKTNELRQTYSLTNDGRELDSAESRVSMKIDYAPKVLHDAIATHWQEFTGSEIPPAEQVLAQTQAAHTPRTVIASFPLTLFSLLSVFGVVSLVTRMYDHQA